MMSVVSWAKLSNWLCILEESTEIACYCCSISSVLQNTQTEKLDVATYNLLTDLRPHVDLETNTVQFCSLSRHVSLAIWSNCSKNLKNKGFLFKVGHAAHWGLGVCQL